MANPVPQQDDATLRTHNNNFTLLRLVAACLVIFGHSFALYGIEAQDPLARLHYNPSHGLGLHIFFIISGYLIAASWLKHRDLRRFALHRALRILPGLAAVILLCVFVIGPVMTTLPLSGYFRTGETWAYLRGILVFSMPYTLPGVFTDLHKPVVNGALWSLEPELFCYMAVALLGSLSFLRGPVLLSLALALMAVHMGIHFMGREGITRYLAGDRMYALVYSYNLFLFAMGAVYYLCRHRMRFSAPVFAVVAGICIGTWYFLPYGIFIHAFFLPYLVLYLALHTPPVQLRFLRENDLSYGMFLWGFVVQQTYLETVGKSLGFGAFVATSLLAAACIARVSWQMVERPMLRLKP